MSQETEQIQPSNHLDQISLLNLRVNDMITQLKNVVKTLIAENQALEKENLELKKKREAS
jgi:hypothetical protein